MNYHKKAYLNLLALMAKFKVYYSYVNHNSYAYYLMLKKLKTYFNKVNLKKYLTYFVVFNQNSLGQEVSSFDLLCEFLNIYDKLNHTHYLAKLLLITNDEALVYFNSETSDFPIKAFEYEFNVKFYDNFVHSYPNTLNKEVYDIKDMDDKNYFYALYCFKDQKLYNITSKNLVHCILA